MTATTCPNSDSNSNTEKVLFIEEDLYNEIREFANRENMSPEDVVHLAIKYIRDQHARTEKLITELSRVLCD